MPFKDNLVDFMKKKAYKPMNEGELASVLNIAPQEMDYLIKALNAMEKEGTIVKTRRGRYGIPEKMNLVVGHVEGHGGFAFLIPEDGLTDDIYISRDDLNGAMHGDKVIVRPKGVPKKGIRTEGEVIRILKRAFTKIVGIVERQKNYAFIIPDDKRFYYDVFVTKEDLLNAKTGQKVVVKIIRWPEKRRNPEGKVVEILGFEDDPGIDILSIIKKYDLPLEFPQRVKTQLQDIPSEVRPEDKKGREDFRDKRIVTIDGEDAKDLDDAISIEKLPTGYRLGVHIADVSYYVKERSALDKEALNRGCSVYLVDRVIPMLPPKLSNGICSLNPGIDRLTMSVIIDFDDDANIKTYKITPGIIRSYERMTYTNVNKIVEEQDPIVMNRYKPLVEDFILMSELAKKLSKRRFTRGSIDFNIDEARVVLDEKGKPIDIIKEARGTAERIIEEFMLITNEIIAEHMYWLKTPFLYRVHEEPSEEKIFALKEFLYNLGYTIKGSQDIKPKSLQQVVEEAEGKPEERLINTMVLRSLKRAQYSEKNLGHFGLAAKFYTHFTAPIRRYPDLIIHRILREHLQGNLTENRQQKLKSKMHKMAKFTSERERIAEDAERESVDLKIAEYMAERVGNIYQGIISGITPFGVFVELENTVEGLVHISSMDDDYYIFNEKNMTLRGERTKKAFKIGDIVRIKVAKVDISEGEIDFLLIK